MNESNIRLAIFYIPAVFGATVVVLKFVAGFIAARKEIAFQKLKENSVGQSAIEKLTNRLDEARQEREGLREDLKEMKEDFKYFKDEIRIMVDAIRKHGISEINETINQLRKLKDL